MSERNEESWGEMAAISRRLARIEIALTERIIKLEAEVAALKGLPQDSRAVYQDARPIDWREEGTAQVAIDEIMQR